MKGLGYIVTVLLSVPVAFLVWRMTDRRKRPGEFQHGDLVKIIDGPGFEYGREYIGRVGRITRTPGATSGRPLYRVEQVDFSFDPRFLRHMDRA